MFVGMKLIITSLIYLTIYQIFGMDNETDYQMASELLSETVDKSVNPCDNFYNFVCKKWVDKNQITPEYGKVQRATKSFFEFTREFYDKLLIGKKDSDSEAILLIKTIMRLCVIDYLNENYENFDIDEAYFHCVGENEQFSSLAFYTTTLNCMYGYETITAINKTVHEMFNSVKEQFKNLTKHKKWIDHFSQHYIEEKLDEMKAEVVYFPDLYNLVTMERVYKRFPYDNEMPYDQIKLLTKSFVNELHKLEWKFFDVRLNPIDINAFYDHNLNKYFAPLGFLKKPIFDLKFPISMKYGSYATIIGHEIVHGFTEESLLLFNHERQQPVLSDYSFKEYNQRRECMIEQYSNQIHAPSGLHVNGTLTLEENIADNGGIKIAYGAFKQYEKEHGVEKNNIPGFENFTNDQIFFISYGQFFCSKYDEEESRITIEKKEHAPEEIRLMTTLVNQKIFSDAFLCPKGSRMNPDDKCEIWKHKFY
uniref:Peptidase_M13 domain-containing protein n=1 Tax=Parastrongyloides trichosuri TaxID=131310 RepID=A0A0N4ZW46_PARTI